MLLDALHRAGVDTACVRRAAGPSSHTVIQVDANGQNSIIVFGGENMRPTEEDIDRVLEGFGPGDAVNGQPIEPLELFQRFLGLLAEDAIHLAAQVPQFLQTGLQAAHILASVSHGQQRRARWRRRGRYGGQ